MEKVAIYVRESNHPNAQDTIRKQERKVTDYCMTKGYSVCDTASIIGDRKEGFPVLMKLLQNAKSKGIDKIVMASTNRVVGNINEISVINEAFGSSEVILETMDGSHNALTSPELIEKFLISMSEDDK